MAPRRNRLSGAEYKKIAKLKEFNLNKVVQKTIKIDTMFKKLGMVNESAEQLQTSPIALCDNLDTEPLHVGENNISIETKSSEIANPETLNPQALVVINEKSVDQSKIDPTVICFLNSDPSCSEQSDHINILSEPNSTDIPGLDPAFWCINEQTRQYIRKNGFSQNLDVKFTALKRLDYLSYFESTGSIYCVPCLLFENKTNFSKTGFSDWKHPKKISYHENSPEHKLCSYKMKELASDLSKINTKLMHQIETEKKYWISLLTRVCSVVKSLASHGLSFRGDIEKFGSSTSNTGNFIMMMELPAEYDPLLSKHISKYGNPGKGNTSYLSFSTYEQFIKIMSEKVINTIVDEIKSSKYFSNSIDSTPDISHTDQLSFVIRYVISNGEPIERFIGFLENVGHKSENLAESVLSVLKKYNLDVCYLRGQSYYNAKNMSGIYSGVQARIKQVSPLADFVPCSAHSLNLVGSCAANCCKEFIHHAMVSKRRRLPQFKKNWSSIKQVLEELINDDYEKPFVRSEARGLIRQMNKLETAYMTVFWSDILHTFNKTSLLLQSVDIDISTVVSLYNSLIEYVQTLRSMFNDYEKLAKAMFDNADLIPDYEHKNRKRKKRNDESFEPDAIFNGLNKKPQMFVMVQKN
ncbi:uncharacterized protein LOC132925391 [Rhopalosiphum padi]|uniref:uncharacterized protein LOC132925391 n=1 Tax=Rhopalosiphum padi TaxID=40932 RepID=UPI00298E6A45|nr:uncharacterized protein LOC132925391 [Rhopalosiphum padi]